MRDLLFVLPLIHLAFCFIFLFFYAWEFGRSIEVFFTPSDVFHVSLKDIATGYLALTVVLAAGVFLGQHEKRRRSRAADPKAAQKSHDRIAGIVVMSVGVLLLIGQIPLAALYLKFLGHVSVLTVLAATICLVILLIGWHLFRHPEKLSPALIGLVIIPPLAAAMSGAFAGAKDGIIIYDLAESQPHCGDYAVIRAIGSYFLAVKKGGGRHLIDESCKERFALPA